MTTENRRADALTPEEIQDRLHRFNSKRNTTALTVVSVTEFIIELLAASPVEQPVAAPKAVGKIETFSGKHGLTWSVDPESLLAGTVLYAGVLPAAAPINEPKLAVWYGSMPESNGKSNWTAILHDGNIGRGITLDRSEYPDRVRYEADRARWLIGELAVEPSILDYDADKHSGYTAPSPADERAALFREAIAWGRAYGDAIPATQWDEMREQKAAQLAARAASASVTRERDDPAIIAAANRAYATGLSDGKTLGALAAANETGAEGADELSPEFTDSARAALLWVLYHHQGGSSPVGQPIRFALGMGAHEALKPSQVAAALRIAEKCRWPYARELPTASAQAAEPVAIPKPIYQARQHSDEEARWDDVHEATHSACAAQPQFYETRIVYDAAPQPPAQADARIDVEALLRACVPGGDICDPQRIADSIREWFDEHGQNAAQAAILTREEIGEAWRQGGSVGVEMALRSAAAQADARDYAMGHCDGWNECLEAQASQADARVGLTDRFIAEFGHRLATLLKIDAFDIADRDAQILALLQGANQS